MINSNEADATAVTMPVNSRVKGNRTSKVDSNVNRFGDSEFLILRHTCPPFFNTLYDAIFR